MKKKLRIGQAGAVVFVGGVVVVFLLGVIFLFKSMLGVFSSPVYPFLEEDGGEVAQAGKGDQPGELVSALEGERLYNTYCVACHQAEGMGKVGFAPYVRNPDFLALASDEYLRKSIVAGRPGTAMTSWAFLKPHEIDSLVAYLRIGENSGNSTLTTADPKVKHPGDPVAGKPLYNTYCASCHGENGTGYAEGGPGPGIGNPGFLAVASDDFIFQTIKHGRAGTAMRPFVGARGLAGLTEAEAGDIIAYMRVMSSEIATAPVEETIVRAGDPKAGEMHFTANCAACHQADGSGKPGFAPSIRNADFLAIASDDFIKDTVKNGRPGTTMMGRPDLDDQTVDDIVAYLRAVTHETESKIKVDPDKDYASLGDRVKGLQTFNIYCASCHGEGGQGYVAGGPGSGIGLKGFLDAASDDYIFQTLKLGRAGTAMRPFIGAPGLANLSEEDAHDIIAYLRSLNK